MQISPHDNVCQSQKKKSFSNTGDTTQHHTLREPYAPVRVRTHNHMLRNQILNLDIHIPPLLCCSTGSGTHVMQTHGLFAKGPISSL